MADKILKTEEMRTKSIPLLIIKYSLSTFAYVSKILSFAIVPFNAVATAISPIISYNHGAMATKKNKQSI